MPEAELVLTDGSSRLVPVADPPPAHVWAVVADAGITLAPGPGLGLTMPRPRLFLRRSASPRLVYDEVAIGPKKPLDNPP